MNLDLFHHGPFNLTKFQLSTWTHWTHPFSHTMLLYIYIFCSFSLCCCFHRWRWCLVAFHLFPHSFRSRMRFYCQCFDFSVSLSLSLYSRTDTAQSRFTQCCDYIYTVRNLHTTSKAKVREKQKGIKHKKIHQRAKTKQETNYKKE